MIQANELRIGNFVNCDGEILPVLAIDSENSFDDEHVGTVTLPEVCGGYRIGTRGRWLKKLKGIPLTPEILANCGFKTARKGVEWTIVTNEELGSVMIIQCINEFYCLSSFPAEFLYVHQLQNLYYALTGKELNIQL